MKKEEIYRRVRILGMLSFIPIVLAAAPLAGFFAAEFLTKNFYIKVLLVLIGVLAGIIETIRILKICQKQA